MFYGYIEIAAGEIDKAREIKVSPKFKTMAETEVWIDKYMEKHGSEETPDIFVKAEDVDDREFGLEFIS